MHKAIVSYVARKPGELTFEEGDVIVQLTAPSSDGVAKGMKQDGSVGSYRVAHVDSF